MGISRPSLRRRGLMIFGAALLALAVAFFLIVREGSAPGGSQEQGAGSQTAGTGQTNTAVPENTPPPVPPVFDGARAFDDAAYQVALGPRIPGSPAHGQIVDWISGELVSAGWQVELQETDQGGYPIRNIIGKRGAGRSPWIVLGAHFDTRIYADKDPDPQNRTRAIDGANDGASGVAVLLELARVLPADLDMEIWLVFFDAEDNGGIDGWQWIMGSRYFVDMLVEKPDSAVILDMIGDADLNIHLERNSTQALAAEIWATAAKLGHEAFFIPDSKYSILDDHVPFLQAGIPAVDIIDFDYPYHHTMADTMDKVSAESLQVVGETVLEWLLANE